MAGADESAGLSALADEELMDRYCAGQRRAFDELFRRYSPRLLRFARTFVGPSHASDVVQVTFLKLHENRHRYKSGARVSAWLFTIARNTALDHVRSAPQRREVHVEADAPAEERARDRLAVDRVRKAVHELPPDQRDVVLLHWFAELGFDEIAAILKASSIAVRARAHRAYEKLRAVLGDQAPAPREGA
jgi:RNA polymerase sigma-70 factor (ECF subfamily)